MIGLVHCRHSRKATGNTSMLLSFFSLRINSVSITFNVVFSMNKVYVLDFPCSFLLFPELQYKAT